MSSRIFPILDWLPNYSRSDLNGDISAGLTVGVMLIPQGMAYAMLAGLPPIYGLYASTIPLIIYSVFGTSRQLAVGPVAMVSLLIASGVGRLAEIGTAEFISLSILLAFMVGALQLFFGIVRLGFLVNFLSHPVISGFTSAAALIIGLNQLKHLMGLDIARSNHIHEILINALRNFQDVHLVTLLLGLSGIAIILGFKKFYKRIPGPLLVVMLGILIVYFFRLDLSGVKIVGKVPSGFPPLSFPSLNLIDVQELLPTALTIALIGFMESIAVAKAIQSKHKNYKLHANQELVGLGVANLAGSVFSAFPTTGGFSRTAVNDQAGAKTGMASIFSALLIVLTLLFLTPLFYYLPQALLASVIMVAVFGLIDYKEIKHLYKTDRKDLILLAITFLGTLILGIEQGIILGILLSLFITLYKSSYPHFAILGHIPGTDSFRNIMRYKEAEEVEGVLIIRFDAQLFFANLNHFERLIYEAIAARKVKLLVINAEAINSLDSSAVHLLFDMVSDLEQKNIGLALVSVKGPVRDIMVKTGLVERIGKDRFYDHMTEVFDHYDGNKLTPGETHFQTNIGN